jgi:NitT/TauT family transport system permease protein
MASWKVEINTLRIWSYRIALIILIMLIWQFGGVLLGLLIGPDQQQMWGIYFSSPTEILATLATWFVTGTIYQHLALTLSETLSSIVIGVLIAIILGLSLSASPMLTTVFVPFIEVFNAMPRLILAPLFILWFGIQISSKIAFGVLLVFWICFFEIYQRLIGLEPAPASAVEKIGYRHKKTIAHGHLSSVIGALSPSSLRAAAGVALVGVMISEYLSASAGLGYLIQDAVVIFSSRSLYAGIIVAAVITIILDIVIARWGAILPFFHKYATFRGRSSRQEFWYGIIFCWLLIFTARMMDSVWSNGIASLIAILAVLLPMVSVQVRRLHDVDRSGPWLLIGFVPLVGGLILLFWFCKPGDPGQNRFGGNPLD